MKRFGLIGYPLGHSMSGIIHKELLKLSGIDGTYEMIEVAPEDLNEKFNELKNLDGFNVTIPHKINIIKNLDGLSTRAELFGAVNTVDIKDGRIAGHNTDCHGFLRALDMAGITLGGDVLVCGAGGAARMFCFESVLAGANLTIAVRDSSFIKANEIKKEIKEKLRKDVKVVLFSDVKDGFDLIINATPVGMYPNMDACVISKEIIRKSSAVFDAIYNPKETLFLKYAKEYGLKYSNGLSMLVWQAAVAEEIWNGVEFFMDDIKKVIDITDAELSK